MGYETLAPKRYLVHDEMEWIPSRYGRLYHFRIRAWRARNRSAVVLASGSGEGEPTEWMLVKLLNYVFRAILHYPAEEMLCFIEFAQTTGRRTLEQITYETIGSPPRPLLHHPVEHTVSRLFLETLIGDRVDLNV